MRRTALLFALAGLVGALVATPIAVYASHQFTDVPDSQIFHNAIGWLADKGVTKGCNPPANTQYCPDDNVTRGQMAGFLKRLSEGQIVDAATAVDAEKLDGLSSSAFMTKNVYDSNSDGIIDLLPRASYNSLTNTPDTLQYTLSTTITAPAPGILILSGVVEAFNNDAYDLYSCSLEIDNVMVGGTLVWSALDGFADINLDEDCTTTGAIAVTAGTYTIDLEISGENAMTIRGASSVWALWVPLDGAGAVPTS